MMYYKIISDNTFIGVATSYDLCKYKVRENMPPLMLICNLEEAQYIVCENEYYHDSWLRPETVKGLYKLASIIEIDKDEYESLNKSIEAGENIDISTTPEEDTDIEETPVDPNQTITLEFIKERKLREISSVCSKMIANGFDVELSDEKSHHFSLSEQDQLNLITLSTMISAGETAIPYHADGESCKFYSVDDITAILNAATAYKTYHVTYHNSLRTYIKSLDDVKEISACEYGMNIPTEYQSDVMRVLLMQQ